jgi:hypothetical protein
MPAELEVQCGWKCPSYFMKTLEAEQVDDDAKLRRGVVTLTNDNKLPTTGERLPSRSSGVRRDNQATPPPHIMCAYFRTNFTPRALSGAYPEPLRI